MKELNDLINWANDIDGFGQKIVLSEKSNFRDTELSSTRGIVGKALSQNPHLSPEEAILKQVDTELKTYQKQSQQQSAEIANLKKQVMAKPQQAQQATQEPASQDEMSANQIKALASDLDNYKNEVVTNALSKDEMTDVKARISKISPLVDKIPTNQVEPKIIKALETKIEELDNKYENVKITKPDISLLSKYMTRADYQVVRQLVADLDTAYKTADGEIDTRRDSSRAKDIATAKSDINASRNASRAADIATATSGINTSRNASRAADIATATSGINTSRNASRKTDIDAAITALDTARTTSRKTDIDAAIKQLSLIRDASRKTDIDTAKSDINTNRDASRKLDIDTSINALNKARNSSRKTDIDAAITSAIDQLNNHRDTSRKADIATATSGINTDRDKSRATQLAALETKINQALSASEIKLSERLKNLENLTNSNKAIIDQNLDNLNKKYPALRDEITDAKYSIADIYNQIGPVIKWKDEVSPYIEQLKSGMVVGIDLPKLKDLVSDLDVASSFNTVAREKQSKQAFKFADRINKLEQQTEKNNLLKPTFDRIKKQLEAYIEQGSVSGIHEILYNTKDKLSKGQARQISHILSTGRSNDSSFATNLSKEKQGQVLSLWKNFQPKFYDTGSHKGTNVADPYKTEITVNSVKKIVNDQLDARLGDIDSIIQKVQSVAAEPSITTTASPTPSKNNYGILSDYMKRMAFSKQWYTYIATAFSIDVADPLRDSDDNPDEEYPTLVEAFSTIAYQLWAQMIGSRTINMNSDTIEYIDDWYKAFLVQEVNRAAKQQLHDIEGFNNQVILSLSKDTVDGVWSKVEPLYNEYKNDILSKNKMSVAESKWSDLKGKSPGVQLTDIDQRLKELEKKDQELDAKDQQHDAYLKKHEAEIGKLSVGDYKPERNIWKDDDKFKRKLQKGNDTKFDWLDHHKEREETKKRIDQREKILTRADKPGYSYGQRPSYRYDLDDYLTNYIQLYELPLPRFKNTLSPLKYNGESKNKSERLEDIEKVNKELRMFYYNITNKIRDTLERNGIEWGAYDSDDLDNYQNDPDYSEIIHKVKEFEDNVSSRVHSQMEKLARITGIPPEYFIDYEPRAFDYLGFPKHSYRDTIQKRELPESLSTELDDLAENILGPQLAKYLK